MTKVIKLTKGLNIQLVGAATGARKRLDLGFENGPVELAIKPEWFVGLSPKLAVKEGDTVAVGDALFVDKSNPRVKVASPVAGVVTAVVRGDRRKLLEVRVSTNTIDKSALTIDNQDIIETLCSSGLMALITQLPYAVVANPDEKPKGIFVSAIRDMPLECPFEIELEGQEKEWAAGLQALSTIAKVHVGVADSQICKLANADNIEYTIFQGPCPAGNVGVHVNHISPINKGEVVWTVDPSVVIMLGRLLLSSKLDLTRTVAVAGELPSPCYVDALIGTSLETILNQAGLTNCDGLRVINGNPLTGLKSGVNDFLGAHSSCVSVIKEGGNADEIFGWIMPRFKQFSVSRSYFSWLMPKRRYSLDARVKGGERHMIMSGEYDRVLPMDIYGEYLIKAIISGNIDKQEALGIYEVSPEDFALAEFVCSSKLPLQQIVREGLNILRKENS